MALLLAAATIPVAAGPKPATNTTLEIKARPRIFNAATADEAAQACGDPAAATGLKDKDAAIAKITKKRGVDGTRGYALGKLVPTPKCALGVIELSGGDGIVLNRLGFDVTGYCGVGAPRFNVDLVDGRFLFAGCADMTSVNTFVDSNGVEWTTKRADLSGPDVENAEIAVTRIVFDEEGQSVLDNIAISNATLKGRNGKRHHKRSASANEAEMPAGPE